MFEEDGSVTNEMHSPDADSAHSDCRRQKKEPANDCQYLGNWVGCSSTYQLYAPRVEVRRFNSSKVVTHPTSEVKNERTI